MPTDIVAEYDSELVEQMIVKKSLFSVYFLHSSKKTDSGIVVYVSWFSYFLSWINLVIPTLIGVLFMGLLLFIDGLIPEHDSSWYIHLLWFAWCFSLWLFIFWFFKPWSIHFSYDWLCRIKNHTLFQAWEIENFYVVARMARVSKYRMWTLYDVQYKLLDGSMKYLYSSFSHDGVFSDIKLIADYFNVDVVDLTHHVFDPGKKLWSQEANKPMSLQKTLVVFLVIFWGLGLFIYLLSVFRPCAFTVC
jgi:hypothetical protein